MVKRIAFGLLLISANGFAQGVSYEDPYFDTISSVTDIDAEFFKDVVEEILFDLEEVGFEDAFGDTLEVSGFADIFTYENYIDMPGQLTSSFVHNQNFGEVRMVYNFGPSQELDEAIAKEWYEGLVQMFEDGNVEREWDYDKVVEQDVAGLPERTTFFEWKDNYELNHVEIYYTRLPNFNTPENDYHGRVVIVFIFPGY